MAEKAGELRDGFHDLGPIKEITVLWLSAGLGCDGESVAITAATQYFQIGEMN